MIDRCTGSVKCAGKAVGVKSVGWDREAAPELGVW